ncbi:MAG: mechanosensitive ion channel family protein [Cyanobacteria bacterium J06638_22]
MGSFLWLRRFLPSPRWRRFCWIAIATLMTLISLPLATVAQDGAMAIAQFPTVPSDSTQPPSSVERSGLLEATDVRLDGQALFRISAPTIFDRTNFRNQVPVEVRARQIENTLQQFLAPNPLYGEAPFYNHTTLLDPDTLRVGIQTLNNQSVLFVDDAYLVESRVVITITEADIQYHSTTTHQLAIEWRRTLSRSLRAALEARQPEAQQQQIFRILLLFPSAIVATVVLWVVRKLLGDRRRALETVLKDQQPTAQALEALTDKDTDYSNPQFLDNLKQSITIQERIQILAFLRWLLFWAIGLVWFLGISAGLSTFPQTRPIALRVVATPFLVLATWFATSLINHILDFVIDRFTDTWEEETEEPRKAVHSQRAFTIANAIKGLKSVSLYIVGGLFVLRAMDLVPASLLALGALVAVALSFTAQSLVRDMINGFLILLEDQYGIGDYIAVDETLGLVENLTLRVTQIRTDSGNLVTIPNSHIQKVENMSRTWARCNFVIEVSYDTDVDKALTLICDEIHQMATEPKWAPTILDPAEVLGVDELSHSGIGIRIWIRTAPLKQWLVAREFRRRLRHAFERHGIQIGIPQQAWVEKTDVLMPQQHLNDTKDTSNTN